MNLTVHRKMNARTALMKTFQVSAILEMLNVANIVCCQLQFMECRYIDKCRANVVLLLSQSNETNQILLELLQIRFTSCYHLFLNHKFVIDLPIWNFDGSSTNQADGHNSDTYLVPRAIYKDPFRRGNHILVMCDTYKYNMEPTGTEYFTLEVHFVR